LAHAAIDKKLADKAIPLETRRQLEALGQKTKTILSADDLRNLRAVEILSQIGTPEARAILGDLAAGGEGAVLTEQARKALARLALR
jgi:HEAT repeat protein